MSMTPLELITYARQLYNAVNDTFFSDAELYMMVQAAQTELARETNCIRRVYTTPTVANQQEYSKPAAAFSIKRITYNGRKLFKISDREDDALTLNNAVTTATGAPQYYWEWDDSIELRPVPDDALTLKIYTYDLPQTVSSTTTLDVPDAYQLDLSFYLLWHMCSKDKNYQAAQAYQTTWMQKVRDIKGYERKRLRGDSFTHVLDEESLPVTIIGAF